MKICVVRRLPTRTPWQGASFYFSFRRPQRKIPIAGSDTPPNSALLLNIYISSHFSFSVCSSELFTFCRLSTACAVFKHVREEKYVVSELILFLTYREIPVVFNLDCGVQELYGEEKRMCFEQNCESGVPYCFVAGILNNTRRNDRHII